MTLKGIGRDPVIFGPNSPPDKRNGVGQTSCSANIILLDLYGEKGGISFLHLALYVSNVAKKSRPILTSV